MIQDSSATTDKQYSYTPYGQVSLIDNLSGLSNHFTYTGREEDNGVTGLLYYRARYYSNLQQRFISEDPIGLDGGINQYSYVNGNPVSYSDPNGKNPLLFAVGIGAVGAVIVFSVTDGDFGERVDASGDFILAYGSAVTIAAITPEILGIGETSAAIFGTSVDAGYYLKSIIQLIYHQHNLNINKDALCPLKKK